MSRHSPAVAATAANQSRLQKTAANEKPPWVRSGHRPRHCGHWRSSHQRQRVRKVAARRQMLSGKIAMSSNMILMLANNIKATNILNDHIFIRLFCVNVFETYDNIAKD